MDIQYHRDIIESQLLSNLGHAEMIRRRAILQHRISIQVIDAIQNLPGIVCVDMYNMKITADSVESAREIVGIILEVIPELSHFEKDFDTSVNEDGIPIWRWIAFIHESNGSDQWYNRWSASVKIQPAPPEADCQPTIRTYNVEMSNWVCERKPA